MNTRIIDTADAVIRRYKTRNPEDIISQRAIKLKDIRFCHDLLGYYTVLLNCKYIGINPNCTAAQRISALAHELGHSFVECGRAGAYQGHVASLCQLRNNFFSKISHKAQYYQLTLKISIKKEPLISQKSQILRFYVYSISPNCTILA